MIKETAGETVAETAWELARLRVDALDHQEFRSRFMVASLLVPHPLRQLLRRSTVASVMSITSKRVRTSIIVDSMRISCTWLQAIAKVIGKSVHRLTVCREAPRRFNFLHHEHTRARHHCESEDLEAAV